MQPSLQLRESIQWVNGADIGFGCMVVETITFWNNKTICQMTWIANGKSVQMCIRISRLSDWNASEK